MAEPRGSGGALAAAAPACGSCGTQLSALAKFCSECGASVPAGLSAEYKQVTVLFADVVRSMDIAKTVGAERLREIMAELVGCGAAVVRRYGGTAENFTGDGLMAVFGAPMALEDHAIRGCLAALAIQEETNRLAVEVERRDGVDLLLRVGLNSGEVVAGEIASGRGGFVAIGEQVGLAQRMESVAPPGAVMLSESTARLVEHAAVLAATELVSIKGMNQPVPARRLVSIGPRDGLIGRPEACLVGRRGEMTTLDAMVDAAIDGRGGVVNVVGPPGIGKSRTAREAAAAAAGLGFEVFWTFCESHARDISFQVVTGLLRAVGGVKDLDGPAARARIRERVPAADAQEVLLLDDLLGIADPEMPLPTIDPDARRRRLTAMINTATLARTHPVLIIVEDAQWIDAVSESMLADFLSVVPCTPSMVLITARPEYQGALARVPGAQTITLAPLSDPDIAVLIEEMLGSDPSLGKLGCMIVERAAGNPFFAEELVRELVQRGVFAGEAGAYICRADVAELSVPATVQAAIEARVDRLSAPAKRTLNAASVIGARFRADMLDALMTDAVFDELLRAELIDQVNLSPPTEYAFRHPLIRSVAYESQLRSDRAQWHRRLAAAIQDRDPASVEEYAALIAEHLEAAGELHAAYGWHMRAAAWSTDRDFAASRLSWERACRIADALPVGDPDQLSMRIAPRTMLCVTGGLVRAVQEGQGRFAELRELCSTAGDKVSLAIGMTGVVAELLYAGRSPEATHLACEQMALLESIGDPTPTIGLAFAAFCTWFDAGEIGEILQWSETVVDLAAGDPVKGAGFGVGSPLAVGLVYRGVGRWWFGIPGWRQDLDDAVAMARSSTQATFAGVVTWAYSFAIGYGVLLADDAALIAIGEAVRAAEESGNDVSLGLAQYTLGVALLSRDAADDRDRGLAVMEQDRDIFLRMNAFFMAPVANMLAARERARRGDRNAVAVIRQSVDDLHEAGRLGYGAWSSGILVETLLERSAEGDLAEARAAIDRLANLWVDGSAMRDITLLRLRALLARAGDDDATYRDLVTRYRAMAESLGFEGHIALAQAMD